MDYRGKGDLKTFLQAVIIGGALFASCTTAIVWAGSASSKFPGKTIPAVGDAGTGWASNIRAWMLSVDAELLSPSVGSVTTDTLVVTQITILGGTATLDTLVVNNNATINGSATLDTVAITRTATIDSLVVTYNATIPNKAESTRMATALAGKLDSTTGRSLISARATSATIYPMVADRASSTLVHPQVASLQSSHSSHVADTTYWAESWSNYPAINTINYGGYPSINVGHLTMDSSFGQLAFGLHTSVYQDRRPDSAGFYHDTNAEYGLRFDLMNRDQWEAAWFKWDTANPKLGYYKWAGATEFNAVLPYETSEISFHPDFLRIRHGTQASGLNLAAGYDEIQLNDDGGIRIYSQIPEGPVGSDRVELNMSSQTGTDVRLFANRSSDGLQAEYVIDAGSTYMRAWSDGSGKQGKVNVSQGGVTISGGVSSSVTISTNRIDLPGAAYIDTTGYSNLLFAHGEMYESNTAASRKVAARAGVYCTITSFKNVGLQSGAGYVVADTQKGTFTIGASGAGIYEIIFGFCGLKSASTSADLEACVFKNGSELENIQDKRTFANASDLGRLGAGGFVQCASGDVICAKMKAVNANSFTVIRGNFRIRKVGP